MPYKATEVANKFLEVATGKGARVSPMKLQKLIYFAQGWALAIVGRPLVEDAIQAWQYGPVVPDVYHAFKRFGSGTIGEPAKEFDLDSFEFVTPSVPSDDVEAIKLIKRIWEVYGDYSAMKLSQMTHAKDSPWDKTYDAGSGRAVIDEDVMREYFRSLAGEAA